MVRRFAAMTKCGSPASLLPGWIIPTLSSHVTPDEWPALLERAPLDLRVNVARASRDAMVAGVRGRRADPPQPLGPAAAARHAGRRSSCLCRGSGRGAGRRQPADRAGLPMRRTALASSTCAPGQEASRWPWPPPRPRPRSLPATPTVPRLAQLRPRAERAGATIATRLLDGGREAAQLADLEGQCDVVLVDAPCSGSGTWRRNPEGRWRLTPERLDQAGRVAGAAARHRRAAGEARRGAGLCHLFDHSEPKALTRRGTS